MVIINGEDEGEGGSVRGRVEGRVGAWEGVMHLGCCCTCGMSECWESRIAGNFKT